MIHPSEPRAPRLVVSLRCPLRVNHAFSIFLLRQQPRQHDEDVEHAQEHLRDHHHVVLPNVYPRPVRAVHVGDDPEVIDEVRLPEESDAQREVVHEVARPVEEGSLA